MDRYKDKKNTILLQAGLEALDQEVIEQAAEMLREGLLVAFPTETVYGLGADATNESAVASIFKAKERPYSDPLIVHIASFDWLFRITSSVPDNVKMLAEKFWPGPLTMVMPKSEAIPPLVTSGGDTVAIRFPSHPVAQNLIYRANVPVAAPSANRFMHTSPTTSAHVLADLGGKIDCIIDGGSCQVGIESTVLDLTVDPPMILRHGGVTIEEISLLIPNVISKSDIQEKSLEHGPMHSPGQMLFHYAPQARLILYDGESMDILQLMRNEALSALAHGQQVGVLLTVEDYEKFQDLPVQISQVGSKNDLNQITRNLYASLRSLDDAGCDVILAHTFGKQGLGQGIWDRLSHAAGGELRRA